MQSMVTLANEIPWIMAPAFLMGSLVTISVVAVVIQNTQQAFKTRNKHLNSPRFQ
jgi:hypothetical protein